MSEKYYDKTFCCYRYKCKDALPLFHLQLLIPVQVFRVEMVEIVHQIKVTTAACVLMVSLEKTVKKVRYYLLRQQRFSTVFNASMFGFCFLFSFVSIFLQILTNAALHHHLHVIVANVASTPEEPSNAFVLATNTDHSVNTVCELLCC